MKRKIFCELVVFVIGIISDRLLLVVSKISRDNYGKVNILVVDINTGEPANLGKEEKGL